MTTRERWKRAQEYEAGFWESVARDVAQKSEGRINFYEWRAGELRRRLEHLGLQSLVDGTARIAELGSGPVGIVGFLPAEERVAVDPLDPFYSANEHLAKHRPSGVTYMAGSGEDLPLESGRYDLVIMENCIDHTREPGLVMKEIRRLLTADGILYLTVNGRSRPGYWMHRLLARLELDPGHPHTFTEGRFRRFLDRHGFELLEFEAGSWWESWKHDLSSPTLRHKAKGLLLVSEHLLSAVARKRPEARA